MHLTKFIIVGFLSLLSKAAPAEQDAAAGDSANLPLI
jgi:hypothetical protein